MDAKTEPCPNCGQENAEGEERCAACGHVFAEGQNPKGSKVATAEIGGIPTQNLDIRQTEESDEVEAWFSLLHPESGHLFPFPAMGNYILGRISEGQSILPDVDFAPIQGFEAGVSRLHAMLSVADGGALLSDLGSSNGTLINGQRLEERVEQKIQNGDKIQLGRLQIQAVIKDSQ